MSSYGYASNLPPGVTTADIDRAAYGYGYDYDDEYGQWWDDEMGCWRDGTRRYCTRCWLEADALDNESGLCAECIAELAAMARKERVG